MYKKEQKVWRIKRPGDIGQAKFLKPNETSKPEKDSKKSKIQNNYIIK